LPVEHERRDTHSTATDASEAALVAVATARRQPHPAAAAFTISSLTPYTRRERNVTTV